MAIYTLSERMVVPLFMPFAFIGLMGLFFAVLIFLIDSSFNPERIAIPLIIGIISLIIAFRKRIATFEEETGEIRISWGKKFPLTYGTYAKTAWMATQVQKRYPVMVMAGSAGSRTTQLPPLWDVIALTKKGKSIRLNESSQEKNALDWQKALTKSFGLSAKNFHAKVYLSYGEKGGLLPKEAWKKDPFFKKDKEAGRLYAEICASGDWDSVSAGNIYDADAPNELSAYSFNIPLLASNAQVTKPWKVVARLQEGGWIEASQKEINQLVALEKKYGWATVDML